MRLARLDLIRYGKFTDKSLSFATSDCDLHLIVGPNEAGKSTIRQAILDLFYGIEKSSPYGFKHGLPEMALGCLLEDADGPLEFKRLKRNKNPLVNAAGAPVPEGDLAKRLGGSDASFYKRMFGLDHATLVAGGMEILNSAGDAGQILFQAAAGIASLHHVRTKLEDEAHALWGDRKRGDAAYYIAHKQFADAEAQLKAVGVTSHKWLTSKKQLDQSMAEAEAALAEYRDLDAQRERLERIRRVAGVLQQAHTATVELAAMGSPVLLSTNAGETLAAAELEIAQANAKRELHEQRLEAETAELGGIDVNSTLLNHKKEIARLVSRVDGFLKANEDRPIVQGQINAKTSTVLALAIQIGWRDATVTEIEVKLPSRLTRAEIEVLLRTQEGIAKDAQRAGMNCTEKQSAITLLDESIKLVPPINPLPTLEAALKEARALDYERGSAEAEQIVALAQAKLDAALGTLEPWKGTLAALRALDLPRHDEVQRFTNRRSALETVRDIAADGLRAKRVVSTQAKVEVDQYVRQQQPITEQMLRDRRSQRDALWHDLRSGEKSIAATGDAYEVEVKTTDDLADRRYVDAAKIEQAQTLTNKFEVLQAEIAELERQANDTSRELLELDATWQVRMTALGLPGLTLDRLTTWSQNRDQAMLAAQVVDEAMSQQNSLIARAGGQQQALRGALAELHVTDLKTADLKALILRAEGLQAGQADDRARLRNLQEHRDAAALAMPILYEQQATADQALRQWSADWARYIAAAGLAVDIGAAGATKALSVFAEMEEACRYVRDQQISRIDPMRQEIDRFTNDARTLAGKCAVELIDPVEIATHMAELLQRAQQEQDRHIRLTAAVAKTRQECAASKQAETISVAKIQPLFDVAQVETIEALRVAVSTSDTYRDIEQRARDARAALLKNGDGLSLERLESEVASEDLAQIEARLSEIRNARDAAQAKRDACVARRTQAQDEFDKIAGQDDAAKAESRRQDALLAMGDAVDEYVRITVGAKLLRWAVERYREERQEPLLKRASETFSHLTRGGYQKLVVDYETEPVSLNARNADGTLVTINGLSTGTEDQLYMALRLAALELHLEQGTPLPFIADDLFINWDDDRAGAGLAALAQLAAKTQVIVLTHHRHLIEVALRATDGRIHLIEL